MISLGVLVAVKGGLRPSLGRFACRSPYDSTGTPRGGALPITGKAALLKYAPTEQRPRLLLHGAWQRFLIFSHNVIGHKQISFAFHPLLARTGHTSQLRILRKEQLSPALRLRLKILIGHSSR